MIKTNELIAGKIYEIDRPADSPLQIHVRKKYKFVCIMERLINGFLVIEYIFKPVDLPKHDVLQPHQAERLGRPDLSGCCRFESLANFKPLKT